MGTWIKRHRKYVVNHDVESMDNQLETVLSSNHPDPKKREQIEQIAKKGQDQHPSNDVQGVLNLSIGWILQGTSELQVSSGIKLFSTWAQHHVGAIESVLPRDLLTNLLTKPSRNQANLPPLLTRVLTFVQNHGNGKLFQQYLKVIENKAHVFVQESPDILCVKNLVTMLVTFEDSLTKGDMNNRLAIPLIRALALNPIPTDERLVSQFINDVTTVAGFLQQTWSQPNCQNMVMDCLKELFNIISAVDGPEPSQCLGALVGLIPLESAQKGIRTVVADSRTTDQALTRALQRLMDCLVWPSCHNIDHWAIAFLKQLAIANKFNILINVIDSRVQEVMEKVKYPPVREASFNILTCMLLGYQYSPQPFHKILPLVREVLEVLEREGAEGYRRKLATLIHCLMVLHTGFPDLYDPVLDLIKDIPSPSTREIQDRLNGERWSNQQCGGGGGGTQASDTCLELAQKSDTGKVGLINLGNTCYMNSVLQTLFMCDGFQRDALMRTPTEHETLLSQLQFVFATLRMSQRPSWRPTKFLAASQPADFIPGRQQDCSEFLKYLLNQIHDQQVSSLKTQAHSHTNTNTNTSTDGSKASTTKGNNSCAASKSPTTTLSSKSPTTTLSSKFPITTPATVNGSPPTVPSTTLTSLSDSSLVRKTFGFKLQSTYRCLECNQESKTVEDFLDMNLAFPKTKPGTALSPGKTLVGGGSPSPKTASAKQQEMEAPQASDKPGKVTHLSELLDHYLKAERLEKENMYRCDRCDKLRDAEKTIGILQCPEYLILVLLRFDVDCGQTEHSKLLREVTCPPTLAVPVVRSNPCPDSDSSSSKTSPKSCTESPRARRARRVFRHLQHTLPTGVAPTLDNVQLYGLCSVIVHSGSSPDCGHYYCYSRHSKMKDVDSVLNSLEQSVEADGSQPVELDFLEDDWCLFNDERVSRTTYSSFSSLGQRYPSNTPYMLVYNKLSLDLEAGAMATQPQLRQEMCDAVDQDNDAFVKEQEQAVKAQACRARSGSTTSIALEKWHPADTDQHSHNTRGSELETSSTRFVF